MSCFSGPEIPNDGLVLCLDAANIKSLPYHPSTTDHGISDWYCFVSGNVTYSCSEPNTAIYQVTNLGVVSTIVASSSSPQRGTFSATAGYKYYGNKPIFLTVEDAQHSIAPVSMAEKLFIYAAQRSGSELGTVYFYSPFGPATVTMYTGGTGVNGTATSTISLTKGQSGTFSITALNWYYFTSTSPVVGTAGQVVSPSWADKTVLSPAKLTVYNRYIGWYTTSIGGTPSTVGSYVIADTTYPVVNQTIADGSGGDTAQGLAYEYLCDRYSWGNVLSDYTIVAPYPNTIVTTYYWSGTAWVVWESHSLSGTMLSPAQVQRDGTNGPGVTSTIISGGAANMASGATLWKWESNNPFYLCINDSTDDELSMLGWMNVRNSRTVSDTDVNWYDVSGNSIIGTLTNGVICNSNSTIFDGTDDYVDCGNPTVVNFGDGNFTIGVWCVRDTNATTNLRILSKGAGGDTASEAGFALFGSNSSISLIVNPSGTRSSTSSISITPGVPFYVTAVVERGVSMRIYKNGTLVSSVAAPTGSFTGASNLCIGCNSTSTGGRSVYWDGNIYNVHMYNRALSSSEIVQNFNALRGRFGI